MDEPKLKDVQEAEAALLERGHEKYVLRLYVAGLTRIRSGPSTTSKKSVKSICKAATNYRSSTSTSSRCWQGRADHCRPYPDQKAAPAAAQDSSAT